MEQYYEEYVSLCMCACKGTEYANKQKVKRHNKAMRKLCELHKTMHQESNECSTIFYELMNHPDERVRLNAAAECIKNSMHLDLATQVLVQLGESSADWSISFAAQNVLKRYCPE